MMMKVGITRKISLKNLLQSTTSEVINVGGLKFMASEVERVALQYEYVELAKAEAKPNPITGQHVELTVPERSLMLA